MNQLCCEQLDWMLSDAGRAGMGIILREMGDETVFFLQSRVCDFDQEHYLKPMSQVAELPTPFRVSSESGIKFCPFCGTELSEVVAAIGPLAFELAKSHSRFDKRD